MPDPDSPTSARHSPAATEKLNPSTTRRSPKRTESRLIVARHILPNLAGVAFAYLMLTVPQVVMVESFLSFLGLGVQEPLTSLGILVKEGADQMEFRPHTLLVPGAVLVAILICLMLLGERLRERFAA